MKIITNHKPRPTLTWHDLTDAERADYDWTDEDGGDSFFRYKGACYCLSEFQSVSSTDLPLAEWWGILPDSYFSAVVVQVTDRDGYDLDDEVIVGMVLT